MDESILKKAKERIVRSLQFSDKSEYDMRKKLIDSEFTEDVVEAAISWAKSKHYIDDARYVESFIRCHMVNKSKMRISYDLTQKGVDKELIENALKESEIDELSQIKAILSKKHYSSDMEQKDKDKIIAALARKGYSWGDIKKAME